MSRTKLIPYLVFTKDEVILEKMRDAQAVLLKDKSIPDHLKIALFEELLLRIQTFKEQMDKKDIAQKQNGTITMDDAVQTQDNDEEGEAHREGDFIENVGVQEQYDDEGAMDDEPYEDVTPPRQVRRKARKRARHDVSIVENMSPSHTRTGTHFSDPNLEPNRVLQKKAIWNIQNQPRWKN